MNTKINPQTGINTFQISRYPPQGHFPVVATPKRHSLMMSSSMMEPIVGTSQKSKKRGSTELDNRNNSLEENRDPEATIDDDEAMNTYKNMMDVEKEYEKTNKRIRTRHNHAC